MNESVSKVNPAQLDVPGFPLNVLSRLFYPISRKGEMRAHASAGDSFYSAEEAPVEQTYCAVGLAPIAMSFPFVRKKIVPSESAGLAMHDSPSSFVAPGRIHPQPAR